MKRFLYTSAVLLLILCNSFHTKAQFESIPDTNFVNWLNANGYSGCMNGNLMDTTCTTILNATSVNCYGKAIKNLDGIQYFKSLNYLNCTNNKLTTLPPLPLTLDTLICSRNLLNLTSLPPLPSSLLVFDCSENYSGISLVLPPSLLEFNCFACYSNSLPVLPGGLLKLNCGGNSVTSLPILPLGLIELDCASNILTNSNFPLLPNGLEVLNCGNDYLTYLPALPSTLKYLYCGVNQLTSILNLPPNLVTLYCGNNQIVSLPATLPSSLKTLNCSYNQLTTIPPMGNFMNGLNCSHNQLSALPTLGSLSPNAWIDCSHNLISSIPNIPNLRHLYCDSNQINYIDSNNIFYELYCMNNLLTSLSYTNVDSLWHLDCKHNLLTSLPPMFRNWWLDCSFNQLNSIPTLKLQLQNLDVSNNPNLTCIPMLYSISNFKWDNTAITCLPNAMSISIASPSISGLTLCQPASGCDFFWNIYGKACNDLNSDCVIDSGEMNVRNIPVKLDSGSTTEQIFYCNTEGYYSFETGLGNYNIKVDTTELPFDVVCPPGGSYNALLTPGNSLAPDLNFGLKCKPGYLDLLSNSIIPSAQLRPGVQRILYLHAGDAVKFYGVSCATGISGTVKAILNGPVTYITNAPGAILPTSVNGDTITWTISDFSLSDPDKDFNISIQIDSAATTSDSVCISLEISTGSAEVNYSNNNLNHCFPIVNSYDPNAKEAYPYGFADTSEHDITYTIYFQNTGNSVAENIYILDTLDGDLNASTFRFLSASHNVVTQLFSGNIIRLSFPGINLPDSAANEPDSHGYIQFKIQRTNSSQANIIISNTAYIYFDLNLPLKTNEVLTLFNFDCSGMNSLDLPHFILSDSAICYGSNITASNHFSAPNQLHYSWLLDSVSIGSSSSVNLTGLLPGQHLLTLTINVDSCSVTSNQSITVFSLPAKPLIYINGDTLSTTQAQSYQWFSYLTPISGANQNSYIITHNGWFKILITDSNGCSNGSDSIFACKSSNGMITGDTAFCREESITIHSLIGCPYPLNYNWLLDSVSMDTTSNILLSRLSPGLHELILTVNGGTCFAAATRTILVFPDPPKPTITINGNTLTSTIATSYQWLLNNNTISNATQNTFVIAQSGWYTVLISDSSGCSALSDSIYVSGVGIAEYANTSFSLHPNPVSETITISSLQNFSTKEIQIFNSLGEIVYSSTFTGAIKTLNLHTYANGLYLLRLKNDRSYSYQKFVKE